MNFARHLTVRCLCLDQTYVLKDACAGVNRENIEATLKKMQSTGIHCVLSDQV